MFDKRIDFVKRGKTTSGSGSTVPKGKFAATAKKMSVTTVGANGSPVYSESGNAWLNEWNSFAKYAIVKKGAKGVPAEPSRTYADVDKTMSELWRHDPLKALKMSFYARTITRTTQLPSNTSTSTAQIGQGLRNEGVLRMLWLEVNHPKTFWKNVKLYISIAGWRDIFKMMEIDYSANGWDNKALDWTSFANLVKQGLEDASQSELIKKWLPKIHSTPSTLNQQASSVVGKFLASQLFSQTFSDKDNVNKRKRYMHYRKLKSSGTAHNWQKLISQERFQDIDWSKVHGKARNILEKSKFFKLPEVQANYEKFTADAVSKPASEQKINSTDYIHEIFAPFKGTTTEAQKQRLEAEVNTAVNRVRLDNPNLRVLSILDKSGSMSSRCLYAPTLQATDVASAYLLFFNELLPDECEFKDVYMEFASTCVARFIPSNASIYEKWRNIVGTGGSPATDLMSVARGLVQLYNAGRLNLGDMPTALAMFSDGNFNHTYRSEDRKRTAFDNVRKYLSDHISEEYGRTIDLVMWDICNSSSTETKFETYGDHSNTFYFSGPDPAALALMFRNKRPANALEMIDIALDQEALSRIIV